MSYPGPEQWMCENDSNGEKETPPPFDVRVERVRLVLDRQAHKGHDGIPGATNDSCLRCNADRALDELFAERDLFLTVVERYGNYWCKDDAYYAAAAALGIEAPGDTAA